jgi:hypothetical protein
MSTGSEMGSDAEMDKSDDLFVLDADKSSEDGEGDEELEPENGDESEFESENESDEEAAQSESPTLISSILLYADTCSLTQPCSGSSRSQVRHFSLFLFQPFLSTC